MKKILTLILCFASISLFAQLNYVKGIITRDGRTFTARIDYREWRVNPTKIRVKSFMDHLLEYNPHHISGFTIVDRKETYVSADVKVNYELPIAEKYITEKVQNRLKLTKDRVFLLTLARGALNLYGLVDKDNVQHYFIQRDNSGANELIRQAFYRGHSASTSGSQTDGYTNIVYSDDFKTQLIELMSDFPNIKNEVKDLFFEDGSVPKLVERYNQAHNQSEFVVPEVKNTLAVHAFAGGALTVHHFEDFYSGHIDKTLTNAYSPTIGLGIESSFSRSNKKFFGGFETSFQQNKAAFTTVSKAISNNRNVDIKGLRYSAYLKYIVFKGKTVQPYIKGGFNAATYFTNNITSSLEDPTKPLNNNIKKSELFAFGSIGLQARRFFFETRFEPGTDINNNAGQNLKLHRVSAVLGYSWTIFK